ncbi:MAG: response regulator [Chloroflexi bacterium]|nr:response regulator [Chloroflexota bacterium]
MNKTKLFLADDHPIVRDGLRFLLNAQPDMEVVGEAADGQETLQAIRNVRPDIVILDIAMPVLNGIAVAEQIQELYPEVQVIILSMHATTEHIFRALRAGAEGYLVKETAGEEVLDAIHTVQAGGRYLSHEISNKVIEDYILQRESVAEASPLDRLSAREREVLQLVAEGRSSAEIADILSLSPKTVDTYRSRMMQKLHIDDLPSLVKFAIQHGVISLS